MTVKKYVNKLTGEGVEAIQYIADCTTLTSSGNFPDILKFCQDNIRRTTATQEQIGSALANCLHAGDWLVCRDTRDKARIACSFGTTVAYIHDETFKNKYTEVSKEKN